ncbi:MAG: response regulator [Actinomycetota bacterium]
MTSPSGKVRVLVVDDHQVFAEALSALLNAEPDFEVVGTASTTGAATAAAASHVPDIAVVDVELGGADGVELAGRLREDHPGLKVVCVTCLEDASRVVDAVRAGASAWVIKDASFEELAGAIRGAMRGESWIPPKLLTGVLSQMQGNQKEADEFEKRLSRLTDREHEVLRCMVAGLDRASIARQLFLSKNTIRTHTQNILAKLEVHSSLEAVALALRAGIRESRPSTPVPGSSSGK